MFSYQGVPIEMVFGYFKSASLAKLDTSTGKKSSVEVEAVLTLLLPATASRRHEL